MDKIRVDRNELLTKVRKNRTQHEQDYKEAMTEYKIRVVQELERMLSDARNGKIEHYVNAVVPKEYLKDYDRTIAMLEMSQDGILEISLQDFDQFVMDNWNWRETFKNSTGLYKSRG